MTVENCMPDTILRAMDKVVILRVEMAVRSTTGSSGLGPISVLQNLDRGISQGIPKTLRSCQLLANQI